jgi:hypothetical protein
VATAFLYLPSVCGLRLRYGSERRFGRGSNLGATSWPKSLAEVQIENDYDKEVYITMPARLGSAPPR